MRLSADKLREDLFQILDTVLSDGIMVEVERKGHIIKIVSDEPPSKLMNLEPHDTIVGDPESLIHIDWSKDWNEAANL